MDSVCSHAEKTLSKITNIKPYPEMHVLNDECMFSSQKMHLPVWTDSNWGTKFHFANLLRVF
jgi:hypothetical protein